MAAAETDCGSSQGSAVTRDPNKSGALAARFGAPGRTRTCGIRLRRRRKSAPTRHPDHRLPLNEPSEVGGPRPPRSASLLCLTSSTRRAHHWFISLVWRSIATPPRWPGRGAASPPVHRSAARSARDRNGWHVAAGEPDGRRQVGDGIQRDGDLRVAAHCPPYPGAPPVTPSTSRCARLLPGQVARHEQSGNDASRTSATHRHLKAASDSACAERHVSSPALAEPPREAITFG